MPTCYELILLFCSPLVRGMRPMQAGRGYQRWRMGCRALKPDCCLWKIRLVIKQVSHEEKEESASDQGGSASSHITAGGGKSILLQHSPLLHSTALCSGDKRFGRNRLTKGREMKYARKQDKMDLLINMTAVLPASGGVELQTESFSGSAGRPLCGSRV